MEYFIDNFSQFCGITVKICLLSGWLSTFQSILIISGILRAQAYDGASNMFGKNTGVSVQIAAEQPKALSTHCQGHSLNLGIKTTMTNSKQMKDVMGTVNEIISLVKHSTKTENLLGNIKDLIHFESLHTDDEIEEAPTLDKRSATR